MTTRWTQLTAYADYWAQCIRDQSTGDVYLRDSWRPSSPTIPPEIAAEVQGYFQDLAGMDCIGSDAGRDQRPVFACGGRRAC